MKASSSGRRNLILSPLSADLAAIYATLAQGQRRLKGVHLILDVDGVLFDAHGSPPEPYSDAAPFLNILKELRISFSVVTAGEQPFQLQKIRRCGIDPDTCDISIVKDETSKFRELEAMCRKFDRFVSDRKGIIVIGDRCDLEIAYAIQLGCTSMRMLRGKYANIPDPPPPYKPDHNIETLLAVPPIIFAAWKTFNEIPP